MLDHLGLPHILAVQQLDGPSPPFGVALFKLARLGLCVAGVPLCTDLKPSTSRLVRPKRAGPRSLMRNARDSLRMTLKPYSYPVTTMMPLICEVVLPLNAIAAMGLSQRVEVLS